MTEESDLTVSVGPDAVVAPQEDAQTEGQVQDQTATPAPEGEDAEKQSEASKRRDRDKAYKERLRQEAADAEARARAAEDRKQKIIKAGESERPPSEADFPDFVELAAAKAVWSARQANRTDQLAALDEEASEARKQAEIISAAQQQLIEKAWGESILAAKAVYADFEQVALSREVPITPQVAQLIKTSDKPADVAYWLGQNRAIAAQISTLPPVEAARAIGRIEAMVSAPKAKTQSSAPAPITPVKGGGGGMSKDPDRMTPDEYRAWREAGGKF